MANMSYVRFENTYCDLLDCYNHINDQNLSISEKTARKDLINLCNYIIDEAEYEEFDDDDDILESDD